MTQVALYPKDGKYIIPKLCCVCGSNRIGATLELSGSYSAGNTVQSYSLNLEVCPEHVGNPTGVAMSPLGFYSGVKIVNLNTQYAQIMLSSNLELAALEAELNPTYENLKGLAEYYVKNQVGGSWVVSVFNRFGVGDKILQGVNNGVLVENVTDSDIAFNFEVVLLDLKGVKYGIEFANHFMRRVTVDKKPEEKFSEVNARGFLGKQSEICPRYQLEIAKFLSQVLRNNDLGYDIQSAAIAPLASCNSTQLVKSISDEDIDVKVRFEIIDKLRKEKLPIENPNYVEQFYTEISNNKEIPLRMRIAASSALGDQKAILLQSINEPGSVGGIIAGLAFVGVLWLLGSGSANSWAAFIYALLFSLGLFTFIVVVSFPFSYRKKLKDVKWFEKTGRDFQKQDEETRSTIEEKNKDIKPKKEVKNRIYHVKIIAVNDKTTAMREFRSELKMPPLEIKQFLNSIPDNLPYLVGSFESTWRSASDYESEWKTKLKSCSIKVEEQENK